jgi:GT2 family glycosyltransferase
LKSATGDYIAYLDSDNDWDSRFLGAMAGAILYHIKSAQALYSGQLVFVGKDREISGVRFGLFNKSLLFNNNYIDLNCFVHKRRIANQLIQFDESIPRFVDWEFIVRISRISPIASVPVLLSNYYLGVSENALTLNDSLKDHIDYVRTKIEANRSHHFHGSDSVVKIGLKNGISIIIPSYEALGDIEKCLETIEPYLLTERKIELIIVDNNSSSDVVRSLDNFSNRYKSCVKFIKLDKNYGFTYAVNRGIEVSNHLNDLLLLNNDAMLTEGSLYTLQQCLYSDDRIGAAVPAQILPGGTESICTHVPYALPEYDVDVNISAHHKNLRFPPLFYEGEPLEIDFAPFFCVLIKNATRMRVPYLDEINGRHYRSDRTYCSFIRDVLGLSIVYCPDSHVYHGLQKSTKELKDEKRNSNDYNTIFVENLWTEDELEKLSFNLPVWNRKY